MCSNWSKVMVVVFVGLMMMMRMMTESAAVPKLGSHWKHKDKKTLVQLENITLQLDPGALTQSRNLRPLENASISPWAYNISSDDSLLTPLSEARCLLRGCLDSEGNEDSNLESRPIMRQVLLLRRVRGSGAGAGQKYDFRLESRLIAVGCTCVRPVILHQQ